MRCMNKVQLIGYLGADPDVRSTQDGTPVAALSMATTERWKDKDSGEPREATEWHRLVLWRGLAEIAQQYLRKGDPVMIEGALKTRKWQDQAGQDHWTSEIVVRDLNMLGGNKTQPQGNGQPASRLLRQPGDGQAPTQSEDGVPFNDGVPF
jgi:single-strand DNA-binding protein